MAACPHCGHEPPAGSAFCNGCGASLAPGEPAKDARPAAHEERKVISILFAYLMGSTALQERLDRESVNRVMDAYYRSVRGPVEAAGGTAVQRLGDGGAFESGYPWVGEVDAMGRVPRFDRYDPEQIDEARARFADLAQGG